MLERTKRGLARLGAFGVAATVAAIGTAWAVGGNAAPGKPNAPHDLVIERGDGEREFVRMPGRFTTVWHRGYSHMMLISECENTGACPDVVLVEYGPGDRVLDIQPAGQSAFLDTAEEAEAVE